MSIFHCFRLARDDDVADVLAKSYLALRAAIRLTCARPFLTNVLSLVFELSDAALMGRPDMDWDWHARDYVVSSTFDVGLSHVLCELNIAFRGISYLCLHKIRVEVVSKGYKRNIGFLLGLLSASGDWGAGFPKFKVRFFIAVDGDSLWDLRWTDWDRLLAWHWSSRLLGLRTHAHPRQLRLTSSLKMLFVSGLISWSVSFLCVGHHFFIPLVWQWLRLFVSFLLDLFG